VKLSILIPTFNEEATIEQLLHRIAAISFPIEVELVVVDDLSQDQTFSIERRFQETAPQIPVQIFRNPVNQGKGTSIATGLQHATGDVIIVQDGDLEYHPEEIPKLLAPLLAKEAEVVYGSRFLQHRWPAGMAWRNHVANRLLTWLANRLCRLRLTDAYTCYKLMPRDLLKELQIEARGFEWEAEVTAKLGRRGVKIQEVPISYQGRSRQEGKKIRPRDLATGIRTLVRYRSRRPS